jgi:uncharacterized integral membrane protein
MQFLKILFWCLLAFVAAIFTFGNWTSVQIHLWGGLLAEVNLPLLLLLTFLLGLLPTLLFHHAVRWRLRSRLMSLERTMANLHPTPAEPVVPAPEPDPPASPPAPPGTLL